MVALLSVGSDEEQAHLLHDQLAVRHQLPFSIEQDARPVGTPAVSSSTGLEGSIAESASAEGSVSLQANARMIGAQRSNRIPGFIIERSSIPSAGRATGLRSTFGFSLLPPAFTRSVPAPKISLAPTDFQSEHRFPGTRPGLTLAFHSCDVLPSANSCSN